VESLDAKSYSGNVDFGLCGKSATLCDEDSTGERRDELFIACREPAPDASRLRRDLARVLLCDATSVVAVFSSLVARFGRSF
jgi:hypothetical protein